MAGINHDHVRVLRSKVYDLMVKEIVYGISGLGWIG